MMNKREIELRVFEALASIAGLRVIQGSVAQKPEPAPDIVCRVVGIGPLAVELTALDDDGTRTRLANMFATKDTWGAALKRRAGAEQTELSTRCKDAHLSLTFEETAGTRVRTGAMSAIQNRVLALAHDYEGEMFRDLDHPAGLHGARIIHGCGTGGPHINASSAGPWLPPQVDKIEEKLTKKKYRTAGPLELFAYANHDEPDGAVDSLAQIDACVRTYLPGSAFKRVRVFNLGFRQLVFTWLP